MTLYARETLVRRLREDLDARTREALAEVRRMDLLGYSIRVACPICHTAYRAGGLEVSRTKDEADLWDWTQTHVDAHRRDGDRDPVIFWRGMHDYVQEAGAVIITPLRQGHDEAVSWIRLAEAWSQRDQAIAALRFLQTHATTLRSLGVEISAPLCRMGFRVMEREAFRFLMGMAGAGMADRDILAVYKSAQRQAEVQP